MLEGLAGQARAYLQTCNAGPHGPEVSGEHTSPPCCLETAEATPHLGHTGKHVTSQAPIKSNALPREVLPVLLSW